MAAAKQVVGNPTPRVEGELKVSGYRSGVHQTHRRKNLEVVVQLTISCVSCRESRVEASAFSAKPKKCLRFGDHRLTADFS